MEKHVFDHFLTTFLGHFLPFIDFCLLNISQKMWQKVAKRWPNFTFFGHFSPFFVNLSFFGPILESKNGQKWRFFTIFDPFLTHFWPFLVIFWSFLSYLYCQLTDFWCAKLINFGSDLFSPFFHLFFAFFQKRVIFWPFFDLFGPPFWPHFWTIFERFFLTRTT